MIASMLVLDRNAIQVFRIKDAYSIHKIVYSLFPGSYRDFLFYELEGSTQGRKVLILSQNQPMVPKAGELHSKQVPKDFLEHDRYGFQVQLNPVTRHTGSQKCIPVIGEEALGLWFLRRQGEWGISVDQDSLEIFNLGTQEFQTGTKKVVHNKATFRGVLNVVDTELFRHSFEFGIGRGKAFGFGLLQLRPLI